MSTFHWNHPVLAVSSCAFFDIKKNLFKLLIKNLLNDAACLKDPKIQEAADKGREKYMKRW